MINLKELKQSLNRFAELQAQRAEEYRTHHLLHEDTNRDAYRRNPRLNMGLYRLEEETDSCQADFSSSKKD